MTLSDGLALIGAEKALVQGNPKGAAYVFDVDPASTNFGSQLAKLTHTGGKTLDKFGRSVALSDGLGLVGAPERDKFGKDSGATFLFDLDPNSASFGQQITRLIPPTNRKNRRVGRRVAMHNGLAIVSSHWHHTEYGWRAGVAYVFDVDRNSPHFATFHSKLFAEKPWPMDAQGDWFSYDVDIQDGVAVAGQPRDDEFGKNSGAAFMIGLGRYR